MPRTLRETIQIAAGEYLRHSIAPTFVRQCRVANLLVSHVFSVIKAASDQFPIPTSDSAVLSVPYWMRLQAFPRQFAGSRCGEGVQRTRTPVSRHVAQRILRGAHRSDVKASRVVMAVAIGRPIEADEDVHQAKCRSVRCVEPTHLVVIPTADHSAHHAQERRLERCPRHGTPYARRDRWRHHCRQCDAEAGARYRRRHPRRILTEEQRLRRNERARPRRLTPESGARIRAWEKVSRQRRAARAAAASAA
jgi:hypothetical protein